MVDVAILILCSSLAVTLLVWTWLMVKDYKDDKERWNKHYGKREGE